MGVGAVRLSISSIAADTRRVLRVRDYFNSLACRTTPEGFAVTFSGIVKGWSTLNGPSAKARFRGCGEGQWLGLVAEGGNQTICLAK